jgi:hypothetical protein
LFSEHHPSPSHIPLLLLTDIRAKFLSSALPLSFSDLESAEDSSAFFWFFQTLFYQYSAQFLEKSVIDFGSNGFHLN